MKIVSQTQGKVEYLLQNTPTPFIFVQAREGDTLRYIEHSLFCSVCISFLLFTLDTPRLEVIEENKTARVNDNGERPRRVMQGVWWRNNRDTIYYQATLTLPRHSDCIMMTSPGLRC